LKVLAAILQKKQEEPAGSRRYENNSLLGF
jgi:hypothetical protein